MLKTRHSIARSWVALSATGAARPPIARSRCRRWSRCPGVRTRAPRWSPTATPPSASGSVPAGAKPGVGSVFVGAMEYQLPETPPSRVRSATFQFSGKQSQCSGGEPVVIDVYAYPGNGGSEVADATAGTRVAQMQRRLRHQPGVQPADRRHAIVRQLSVPAGIRHVGFNMRKANNRQGPGLFGLSAGKLTVVVADQDLAQRPTPAAPPMPGAAHRAGRAVGELRGTVERQLHRRARGSIVRDAARTWSVEAGSIDIVNARVRTEAAAFDGTRRSTSPARRARACCRHALPRTRVRTTC